MAELAIIVEFVVPAAFMPRFRQLIADNARQSLTEPGCRRFDVLAPEGDAERMVLYEIYDDEAAFQQHLTTPHYKSFAAAIAGAVAKPMIRRLVLLPP
jgi:(4S)-4-hydroxy-5-phosphonooxypentane-2,3-dione isomerase